MVLAGVAAIVALYRFGSRYISRASGIISASLLAALPIHILCSRQIRPYPLILLLEVVTLSVLRSWAGNPRMSLLILLAALNTVTISLHHLGIALMLLQCLYVATLAATGSIPSRMRNATVFFLLNCLASLPTVLFVGMLDTRDDMLMSSSFPHVFIRILATMDTIFRGYFQSIDLDEATKVFTPASLACLAVIVSVCILGYREIRKSDRLLAVMLGLFALVPPFAIAMSGQGFFRPRHIMPFTLPILILAGPAFARYLPVIPKGKNLALASFVCLPLATAILHRDSLYLPGSYANYRMEAQALSAAPAPGNVFAARDQFISSSIGWYLRQNGGEDVFRTSRAGASDTDVTFNYITGSSLTEPTTQELSLFSGLGTPTGWGMVYDLPLLKWTMRRTPVLDLGDGNDEIDLPSTPKNILARSYSYRGIQLHPLRHLVTAAENNLPGELVYAFSLDSHSQDAILVESRYRTTGEGNRLDIGYAYDDGPSVSGFSSRDKDPGDISRGYFLLTPPAGTRMVKINLAMDTGLGVPDYPGSNLATNGLFGLHIQSAHEARHILAVDAVTFHGISHEENLLGLKAHWATGPRTSAVFTCPEARAVRLSLRYISPFKDQNVRLTLNGKPLNSDGVTNSPDGWVAIDRVIETRKGGNELVLEFERFNHHLKDEAASETFAPEDPRKLAVIISDLTIGNARLTPPVKGSHTASALVETAASQ